MASILHNPASSAHLEELKDRLATQLAAAPRELDGSRTEPVLISHLVDVVRSMDQGTITSRDALQIFTRHPVPGFHFGRWIIEMVDEGVYLDAVFDDALQQARQSLTS